MIYTDPEGKRHTVTVQAQDTVYAYIELPDGSMARVRKSALSEPIPAKAGVRFIPNPEPFEHPTMTAAEKKAFKARK